MDFNFIQSKKRQKSSSDLLQIKQYAAERILTQMVGTIRKNCTLTPEYIILVLDCFTARQFVQLDIRFFDMYKFKVFQVEDLTKMRKRYP
jgi:hypothetical protein